MPDFFHILSELQNLTAAVADLQERQEEMSKLLEQIVTILKDLAQDGRRKR